MAGLMKNVFADMKRRLEKNILIFPDTGAPVDGTSGTGVNFAGIGSLYINVSNGAVYQNTGSITSPTWNNIGSIIASEIVLATGSILVGTAGIAAAVDGKTSGNIFIGDGTTVNSVAVTGDVTISSTGVTALGANKTTSAQIATNVLQRATGTITAADIISTSAGKFGHAQGYIMVAAPAAGFNLSLNKVLMHYTFGVAAYTAGGNITVNFGAGGAALTGLVSAANSVGAASSKSVAFYPLSTVGVPMVSAAALNLVSSVAFTNPGTATGTIVYEVYYTVNNPGF